MNLEDLPMDVLEWLKNLDQGNTTYRSNIVDAFDIAVSFDEAAGICTHRMEQQISEAKGNIKWLKDRQKQGEA